MVAGLIGEDWQDELALGDGAIFPLLLTRKGVARQVELPRRRRD